MPGTEAQRSARAWLWPLVIMVTVFLCSGQSTLASPDFGFSLDKIAHFAVFGALATAWLRLPFCQRRPWLAFLFAALYGAADEYRQSFTPGRSVEFDDFLADALGALTAVVLYQKWPFWRRVLETPLLGRNPNAAKPKSSLKDASL